MLTEHFNTHRGFGRNGTTKIHMTRIIHHLHPAPLLFWLVSLWIPRSAPAQSFDQMTRPMVTLTDQDTISQMLSDLIILPRGEVTSMSLIDITLDGYGANDMLILHPSAEVHYLGAFIPPRVRNIVLEWEREAGFQMEAERGTGEGQLINAHMNQDPQSVIAGMCANAVDQHYAGDDLNLLLSRDSETVQVEIWGFDPSELRYGGASDALACELNRQRFEFARPLVVTAFHDAGDCVEIWGENGEVKRRPCAE